MKLAIIGSYGHVGVVLAGAAAAGDVRLVAAARWGPDDPLGFVGHHPAAPAGLKVYDDYRVMLDEQRPDVAASFLPLYRNAEASIAACRHGCHVVSEKPLATTLADLAALREAADGAGVQVIALMTMRGEPSFAAARQVVAEGRIGRPVLAAGQKSYPFATRDDFYKARSTYGGSIPWQAIHALDFVSYCTGRGYRRAAAMHANVVHPSHAGMEDSGGILLELEGGGHAIISFDYLRPWSPGVRRSWGDDRLRIAGSEGVVEVVEGRVRLMTPTQVQDVPLPAERNIFAEFVASVRGETSGLITAEESFRITEVALKARDAADEGRIVEL